jgi:hypothetical protein
VTRARLALVAVLIAELFVAARMRWPLTTGPIHNAVEYQIGQVVITSERWRREGALATHLMPSRSIDHRLTDWAYYDQDYVTVPPLSFMLHYAATRALSAVDAVVLAKIVAQLQIAVGLIAAALLLLPTFGFWPTLLALSFLIWTPPFFIWFIDGYFPTTTALLVQLVFVAWVLRRVRDWTTGNAQVPARMLIVAAVLSALGVFSDAIGLAVDGCVVLLFLSLAWDARSRARPAPAGVAPNGMVRLAAATAAGAAVALAVVVALYATTGNFGATFADRFARRSGSASERVSALAHTRVIWRQMQYGWPKPLLWFLLAGAVVLVLWAAVTARRQTGRGQQSQAAVYMAALLLGILPSATFHYVLQDHVTIHWWFTGTWVIAGALIIAMVAQLAGDSLFALWHDRRLLRFVYPAVAAVLVVGSTVMYARALDLPSRIKAVDDSFPAGVYQTLGRQLPRDGYPLMATHLADFTLFTQYPYTSAQLRRPVVLLDDSGVMLPHGAPADVDYLREFQYAYVAFNPFGVRCDADAVPLTDPRLRWLRICRVAMSTLLERRAGVLQSVAPESITTSMAPASVVRERRIDEWLVDVQQRLSAGQPWDDSGALLALARVMRTRGWPDPSVLRTMLERRPIDLGAGEPALLLRKQVDFLADDTTLAPDVIRPGTGATPFVDMHTEARFEGFTVQPAAEGMNEITVYFRPQREWSARRLWVHAYPAGSAEYVEIEPVPPAFDGWSVGELAWEVFRLPGTVRYNAYLGVAVGPNLGPAVALGWIDPLRR